MLTPRISDTKPPPFHEMGPVKFQEFSAELLGKEERFEDSQVYGLNGQAQLGIDVLAPLKQQRGIEVCQCKCWESTSTAKIKKATDEFLPHLYHWRSHKLKRFVLLVACSTDHTKIQEQILVERRRFNDLGIDYEVWDARKLRSKLRSYPELVRVYCGEPFVQIICGPQHSVGGTDAGLPGGIQATLGQWGLARAELAESRDKDLEAIRDLAAEGHTDKALGELESLCAKPAWHQMPAEIQGKALRIKASLILSGRREAASAKLLLLESKRVHPGGDTAVLEALLIHHEQGSQAAASFLGQPKTLAEWNLRQRLLLELGRPEEVLQNFRQIPAAIVPNEQSAWAKAIALLLTREVEQAHEVIREALRLKPRHFDLRLAAAMVAYASAVSPLFGAWGHLDWPIPPPWNLVRRDSVSRENLREAAKTFRDLQNMAHGRGFQDIQIWELACLGNDPERQEEAEQMIKAMLHQCPSLVPVVIWARERGYSFERESVLQAMRKKVEEPNPEVQDVMVCFSLTADEGDLVGAEKLLDSKRDLLIAHNADHLWAFHKVQLLAAQGKTEESRKIIEAEGDEKHRRAAEAAALRSSCVIAKDFGPLAKHLEHSYLQTKDATVLLDCCLAKRELNEWRFIADHAKELVCQFQTEPLLRLAAQGAVRAHEPALCIELLEGNKHLCIGSRLPADLRHLLAECHRQCGHLPQAITEAEKLVQEGVGLPALAQLFQLQHEKGDLQAMALTARKFRELPAVPPQLLIEAIPLVKHQDPQLAHDLWRQVLKLAHNDPNVAAAAVMEAFPLGVEHEAGALFPQVQALAEQPGSAVQALTIEDAAEFLRAAHQEAATLVARYEKGEIPVHFFAPRVRMPLARLFHENPAQNQATLTPLTEAPLFIRHGSKAGSFTPAPPKAPSALFMDITSVLLAKSIGLLPIVEQQFHTISVSAHLTQSLLAQLELLSSHQPSLLKANQRLLALIREESVKTGSFDDLSAASHEMAPLMGERWCARLEQAKQAGGVIVDYLPLRSNRLPVRPVTLPADLKPLVVSAQQVLRAMAASGLLSAVEAETAMLHLGNPNSSPQAGTPVRGTADTVAARKSSSTPEEALALRPGMQLRFAQSILTGLAQSVALERLAGLCQVVIDQDEADALDLAVKQHERNVRLKEWVTELLAHLSDGIGSGKYLIHQHPTPKLPHEPAHALNPEELCLYDAIHFGEATRAFIWCDDRSIRAHDRVEKSELGDTFDMLQLLRGLGIIQEEAYFDYFLKLRAANARYLPLGAEEILHHLRAARVQDGVLQESHALRTLRRHAAACLLDRSRIQEPVPDGRGGLVLRELAIATAYQLSVLEALRSLWSESNESPEDVSARADWLWPCLCADMRIIVQCFGKEGAVIDSQAVLADSIAHLLSLGLGLRHGLDKDAARSSQRQAFFNWVETRAILPLLLNNPNLAQQIAHCLTQHLSHAERLLARAEREHGEASQQATGIKVVIGLFIADLPPLIQAKLDLSAPALSRWGLQKGGEVVDTLGLQFPAEAFWSAAARAVNAGRSTLFAPQGREKLQFSRGPTPTTLHVSRKGKAPKQSGMMNNDILLLLHNDRQLGTKVLSAHHEWFDLDADARTGAIQRILSEDNAAGRVALLNQYREATMGWFYKSLTQKLREQKPIDIAGLLPNDMEPLRRHLRLERNAGEAAADTWQVAVNRLIEAEGLAETISRLSCLPAAIPDVIYEGLRKLDSNGRATLLRGLTRSLAGPLQSFHLLALCAAFPDEASDILATAEQRIRLLCDPDEGLQHCRAFLAVLKWVHLRLGWHQEALDWPIHLKLRVAWLHASSLYRSFCITRIDPKFVEDWFSNNSREFSRDDLSMNWQMCADAATPPNVFPFPLVLRGMAYCLADAAEDSPLVVAARESLARFVSASAGRFNSTYPLLRKLELCSNVLESFLGENAAEMMVSLLGVESYKALFCAPETALEGAINAISLDPQNFSTWVQIDSILGDGLIPKDSTACIGRAAASVDLVSAFRQSKPLGVLLAILVSKCAGRTGDQGTKNRVLDGIAALAREANATQIRSKVRLQDDEALVRLAAAIPLILSHVCGQKDPAVAAETLCKRMSTILREWPAVAAVGSQQLDHLIRQLPLEFQRAYWPLTLTSRAVG